MPGAPNELADKAHRSEQQDLTETVDAAQRNDVARVRLDLRENLERLPKGHPSSPYNVDGTRKPPVASLAEHELALRHDSPSELPGDPKSRDSQQVQPFTDAEYANHVRDIRARLAEARRDGLNTQVQHTVDSRHEVWSSERRTLHNEIIKDIYSSAVNVPCEGYAIIAGGLPGAGKTTILDRHAGIDRSKFLTINPDQIKEEMANRGLVPQIEGLSPMEASDLVHEESSHIAKRIAFRAQGEKKNIIWDITMSTLDSTLGRINDLRESGYTNVEGIFVDLPPEVSAARAAARHRNGEVKYRIGIGEGGRFIPEEAAISRADDEWGTKNRRIFEAVKPKLDRWTVYDNSADGRTPVLLQSSHGRELPDG